MSKNVIDYFKGDELAANVWLSKYALRDKEGNLKENTPDDMHKRLATEFARIEQKYPNSMSYEEIYNLLKDFKYIIPGGSILFSLGNPYTYSSLGNCFSYNTNIITNEGIKKIGDLVNTSPILFSTNGKWIKSEVKSFGKQKIVKLVLRRNNIEKIIETTKDHIWFAQKYRSDNYHKFKTEDLKQKYILKYNFSKNYHSYIPSPFGVSHGFYTGDGSKFGNNRIAKRVKLCKYDKELLSYFTPYPYTIQKNGINIGGLPNYFKNLPDLNENVSYLYGWLAGYFAADGCIDSRGSVLISSVDKNKLEYVKNLCAVLGIGTYPIRSQNRISNLTNRESTIYNIGIMSSTLNSNFFIKEKQKNRFKANTKKDYWRVQDIIYTNNEEEVYCAIVPEEHSFTLEDNILTHNCFVIGNQADSYGGILTIDREQVELMKRRGGVGHDISHLRPKDSHVSNSAKSSTGAVSFMERFSHSTREVAQDGRRGALMLTINVLHPDIEDFIVAKDDLTKITGANISVKITDDFMYAVKENRDIELKFNNKVYKVVNAKKLWNKIIHQAWKSAEPGLLFWDRIISESPADCYEQFQTISTNPCGEIPLSAYDSCRLMSINLYSMVDDPFTKEAKFNFHRLRSITRDAQRLMDDIIDLEEERILQILDKINKDPEPNEIKSVELNLWKRILKALKEGRRTGLSGIGLADCIAALGLKFDSDEAIKIAGDIYYNIGMSSYDSSVMMAKERGCFPLWNYELEKNNPFIKRIECDLWENYREFGRRNISTLTIPPSGSISILAGISSGIEPIFALYYNRKRKLDKGNPKTTFIDASGDSWEEYKVYHPKYKECLDLMPQVLQGEPLRTPYDRATSHDIDPIQRIKLQAAIQPFIDHSISSTLNLSKETTEEEISNIYMAAWENGLKGCTVYREGSRDGVLTIPTNNEDTKIKYHDAPKRPKVLDAELHVVTVKGIKYAIIVGLLNGQPYEIFAWETIQDKDFSSFHGKVIKVKKGNYKFMSHAFTIEDLQLASEYREEIALTILTSMLMRHGAKLEFIIKTIDKIPMEITAFGKAVIRVIKKYIKDGTIVKGNICPECNNDSLIYENGCVTCTQCGYSKC